MRSARLAAVLLLAVPLAAGQFGPSVRDSLGRTVTLPAKAGRVIAVQPEIARMLAALGASDTLVGIDFSLRSRDPLFNLVHPEAGSIPIVSNAENAINLELVLKLAPDIIFVSPFERRIVEALERKTRIPTVALASLGDFDRMVEELILVGKLVGREERAMELAAYFRAETGRVRRMIENAPAAPRPRVFLSFWGSLTRTPTTYAPVEAAGGINLADGIVPDAFGSVQTTVNVERILRWDPDIILVHGNYLPAERAVTVERVLADRRLSSLRAVKSGRVHYTFGFWNWWDMAETTLETLYLAALFHPEIFPDFDLEVAGEEVFTRFYGRPGVFRSFSEILGCRDWGHE